MWWATKQDLREPDFGGRNTDLRILTIVPNWPSNFRPDLMPWLQDQVTALAPQNELSVLVLESLTHYLHPRYFRTWLRTGRPPRYYSINPDVRIMSCNYLRPPRRVLQRNVSFPLMMRAVRRALGSDDVGSYDLIHAHFSSPAGTVARILSRETGIPYVVTEHSSQFDRLLADGIDVSKVVRDADAVICVSPGIEQEVRDTIDGELDNLRVIPNGVDTSAFKLTADVRPRSGPLRLLFVGHLIPRKGADVLLTALRRLTDNGMKVELTIIGIGAESGPLHRQAETLGISSNVHFAGGVSHGDIAHFFSDCDVFVLPSFAESFGVVVIEALATGKPVIATRSGGPEHIIDESVGMLVEPGDVEALASAIQGVGEQLETYVPSRLSAYVESRYSIATVADKVTALYKEVADNSADLEPHV